MASSSTKFPLSWSKKFIKLVNSQLQPQNAQNSSNFLNFKLAGKTVGKIQPSTAKFMQEKFSNFFQENFEKSNFEKSNDLTLKPEFDQNFTQRSEILNKIANHKEIKQKFIKFPFRFEQYPIHELPKNQKELSEMTLKNFTEKEILASTERSSAPIFGMVSYGTHMTIFRDSLSHSSHSLDKDLIEILVPRRSATKSKYPNYYDNSVAGGVLCHETAPKWDLQNLDLGLDPLTSNMQKESQEEAGLSPKYFNSIKYIGNTTYLKINNFYCPRIQFNYQLKVGNEFIPEAVDGEVGSFEWCDVERVKELLVGGNFKPNSMVVLVHFLVYNGILNEKNCEGYQEICGVLRR